MNSVLLYLPDVVPFIDSLELVAQISQDQLKLGKLQNMVDDRTRSKQAAAVDAQNSASDNVRAAEKLNDDPNNKKLASDANSKAGDAKSGEPAGWKLNPCF